MLEEQAFCFVGSGMHILPLHILPVLQSVSTLHWNELGGGTIGTHLPLSQAKSEEHAGTQELGLWIHILPLQMLPVLQSESVVH